jgi:hypothetical protein
MATCGNIFTGQSISCTDKPTGGIEQRIVLLNRADIDLTASTVDSTLTATAGTHKVTSLACKSGKTGYEFSSYTDKRLFSAAFNINRNEDAPNDYTHTLSLRAFDLSEASLVMLKALGEGAEVVAIIEYNDKGASEANAFGVYGWSKGLKVGEMTFNSNENKGTVLLTMASQEPDLEPFPPMLYSDTDYDTSLAAFDNLFATA